MKVLAILAIIALVMRIAPIMAPGTMVVSSGLLTFPAITHGPPPPPPPPPPPRRPCPPAVRGTFTAPGTIAVTAPGLWAPGLMICIHARISQGQIACQRAWIPTAIAYFSMMM